MKNLFNFICFSLLLMAVGCTSDGVDDYVGPGDDDTSGDVTDPDDDDTEFVQSDVEKAQRVFLMALYASTGGDDWTYTTNWGSEDVSISEWFGVSTNSQDYVVGLNFDTSRSALVEAAEDVRDAASEVLAAAESALDTALEGTDSEATAVAQAAYKVAYAEYTVANDAYNEAVALDKDAYGNNLVGEVDLTGFEFIELAAFTGNDLSGIKVDNLTDLKYLTVGSNPNLTTLDVSTNESLYLLDCSHSAIDSLNLSAATTLRYLYCNDNKLSTLDVSACTEIKGINCADNQLELFTTTDELTGVSNGLTALTSFDCSNNTQLAAISLSKAVALVDLDCSGNAIKSLTLTNSIDLQTIDVSNNSLTALSLAGCIALTGDLICHTNPSMKSLILADDSGVSSIECHDCPALTSLDLSGQSNLVSLYGNGAAVLASIELPTSSQLQTLQINDAIITELDLSLQSLLEYLACDGIDVVEVDLTGAPLLSYVSCKESSVTSVLFATKAQFDAIDPEDNDSFTNSESGELALSDYTIVSGEAIKTKDEIMAEQAVLLGVLYDATGGVDWTSDTGWKKSYVTDLDNWYGITVNDEGYVISINLGNNNVKGGVDLTSFTYLEEFVVYGATGDTQPITSVNVVGLSSLKTLVVTSCQITSLDLTGLSSLYQLECGDNDNGSGVGVSVGVTALDFTETPSLNLTNNYMRCSWDFKSTQVTVADQDMYESVVALIEDETGLSTTEAEKLVTLQ